MKKRLLIALLLGASAMLDAQVSIGIRIGPPPAPRVVAVRPIAPGPDYIWLDGYWYADGHRWLWHDGYWTRPPYVGAHWVPGRHENGMFYAGFWDGPHGRVDHDHHWDRDHRARDYDRRH